MEIETERLRLRPHRLADFEAFAAMVGDEETMRFLGGASPDAGHAWQRIAVHAGQWALRGFGEFAVEEKGTGTCVGSVGPWYPEGWPQVELAWALARPFWGKGYATEAARAAAGWMFEALNLTEIVSFIHPGNAPSVRVAERLGEIPRGTWQNDGSDLLVYAMTREGFGGG